jgi:sugar phosphate isomerase/epimerase
MCEQGGFGDAVQSAEICLTPPAGDRQRSLIRDRAPLIHEESQLNGLLPLGATTLGYAFRTTLEESIRDIAGIGFRLLELAPVPPHLNIKSFGKFERFQLRRLIRNLGLRCVSLNPIELNLISPNTEFRELSSRQYLECVELAHDLDIGILIILPGRRHTLIPAPFQDSLEVLRQELEILLARAEPLGVTLALETSPYGFLGTGATVAEVVDQVGHPNLGVCFDCANVLAQQDPVEGVREAGHRIRIAHLSDTWRNRYAHTGLGTGDVDFAAYGRALHEISFAGPSVYELADGEDPSPRLRQAKELVGRWGWEV